MSWSCNTLVLITVLMGSNTATMCGYLSVLTFTLFPELHTSCNRVVTPRAQPTTMVMTTSRCLDGATSGHDMMSFWDCTGLAKSVRIIGEVFRYSSTYIVAAKMIENVLPIFGLIAYRCLIAEGESYTGMTSPMQASPSQSLALGSCRWY